MINKMVLVMKLGQMVLLTEEIIIKVRKKAKAYLNGQMVLIMRENFLIIPFMELGINLKLTIKQVCLV